MQTRDELLRRARAAVAQRRQRAVMRAETAKKKARDSIAGYREAEGRALRFGLQALRLTAAGAPEAKRAEALALSRAAEDEARRLLEANGLGREALTPQFTCPHCQDTGVEKGLVCRCVRALEQQYRREEISAKTALHLPRFADMDLSLYPERYDDALGDSVRHYMGDCLAFLRQYAASFTKKNTSLLITGDTGLGKTHAALAVAGEVLERGYDVIYLSSQELFGHLEKQRFDRDAEAGGDTMMDAVLEADLLILDDLGTEFVSPFVISTLYTIVNTRLGRGLPSIYTSNIVDDRLFESRYTAKIASRLFGGCERLEFFGEDLREKLGKA